MGGFLELIATILVTISAGQAYAHLFDRPSTSQRDLSSPPSEHLNRK